MSTAINTPVGFVGLGNMGWPMARNLRQAGFDLVVYDAAAETATRFADEFGARVAAGPSAFTDCHVVVTMLPNDGIVRQVVLDWEGGIASQLKPGSIVLDMSSSSPTGIQGVAEGAAGYEVIVVDSPVSGGVPRAETGELSLMVGGDDAAVAEVTPILEVLGARIFHTGPLGTGDTVKALNNFLAAANYVAATEALRIGERFGVDPATLFEIINTSTGRSFVTEIVVGGNVVPGTYATGFQLALLAKDVGIAAGLASELDMADDSPALGLTNQRWQQAAAAAAPGTDHSAAHREWWPQSEPGSLS
jgi:3-hydroxyisobutyrate dehydrogenase